MHKASSQKVRYGWLIACFINGMACCITFFVLMRGSAAVNEKEVDKDFDSGIARSTLTPADVVTMQINSIRASVDDLEKLKICYSLASQENRSHTGPFSRFSKMVTLPPYDRLASCMDWQLGGTVIDKELAAVLVSTISNDGEISGYRFILQRQICNTEMCWLTEGVEHLVAQTGDRKRQTGSDASMRIE